jgi:hypothetical protein
MIVLEAFIIEVTFKIAVFTLESKETFNGFDVCKILICRGNYSTIRASFDRCFNIFEQQNKASLFYKADRKRE